MGMLLTNMQVCFKAVLNYYDFYINVTKHFDVSGIEFTGLFKTRFLSGYFIHKPILQGFFYSFFFFKENVLYHGIF